MKVATALILCAITLARGQEVELNENGCPIDYRYEQLYTHEICNKFYQCTHGELVVHTCAGDLLFNEEKQECDWPHDTDCGHRIIPGPESEESEQEVSKEDNVSQEGDGDSNGDNEGDNNGNGDNNTTCNCNPGEAPAICAEKDSEGILIAHENCNQFYKCSDGVPVAMSCYGNLLYNPYTKVCDWPDKVECGERVIPDCDENNGDNGSGDNNNGDNGSGDNNNGENGSDGDNNSGENGDSDNGNDSGTGSCNCNPGEAPSICAGSGSEGVLIAHENCNQFYKCSHGVPVAISCFGDLLYNPKTEQCDWPSNVNCGDRVMPECDDDNNNNGDNNSNGDNASGGNNNGENGSGDNNSEENGSDGDNNTGGSGDNGNENGTGSCNCNPGEAPAICAGSGSEGVLIAHENCNQFYKCSHGFPVAMSCFGDLLYNPKTEQCDWPSNVNCGDRVMPECDDDNNNNGDNNSNGDNASGGNNNGENGSGDNNSEENGSDGDNNTGGSGDNGNENGTGSCNCNPGEAPAICAGSGSEGVLIAHENCNQFYKCSHGVPVAMSCFGDLLYNPKTEQCDWPSNVNCGDRIMPECDDDNNNNGDNNSNGDNASGGNNNGENGSGNNNSEENGSDGDNNTGGNGDNGNENGTGSCNCNPGEAPAICAGSGSEGVLIAHENCNQFYKCSHGVPVAMSCYGDLLYNPKTEQCDWPNNVNCGDRVMPECDDDNNNNGDNNSNGDNASGGNNSGENGSGDNNNGENGSGGDNNTGGNGNGDNGNENGTGTCNCNPGEAPSICAGSGSEGVLVAHENCNQFYICSHGVPVAMSCFGDLLYNPYTERCDWPNNVECGNRVMPECDDDNNNNGDNNSNGDNASGGNNNGENGSGDNNNGENGSDGDNNNGGNGNGDNDNENGTGSCNCNPGEAPSICAGSGSEGVLVAHENCNQFYICSHGVPVAMSCFGDLLYNPYTERCDWPNNVECGNRVMPECDDDNNNNGDNNSNGDNASGGNNNGENGSGDNNNGENGSDGDNNNGGNGNGDNDNENGTGSCNCNPGEAPSICAGSGSEGVLVAHENCNQFYICSHGVPVAMSCFGDLLYNPYTERCDWPNNVECGYRVMPECDDDNNNNGDNNSNGDNASGGNNNGENGSSDNNNGENGSDGDNNNGGNGNGDNDNENGTGSCNCNPGEAPSICAGSGSEGVLVAHENCNQFYICSHGVPVAMSCFGDLLYNPYTERCDWPNNVECGNRVMPECDDDNNNNGDNNSNGDNASGGNNNGENGSSDNNNGENGSDGDNNNGGNGNGDNGNENGTGSCNCNPGEAPSICAGTGSEGVLVAHENCNQFYICSHGVPVAMSCFGDLLYNPYTERCDWPNNIECGNRVMPECDDDNNNNGDNNSNGDNASGGNNNGENGSGDNNNGENGSDGDNNNGGNGNGDNGNENGTGSCNCNPGEAPAICAGSGSEGMLIAHENCNQFYKCSHGVPVAMSCYGDLLYNPKTEQCDWPSNVNCGDRVKPECDDDNNNNGDNNSNGDNASGGNNNGENGSGDNNSEENGSDGDNNSGGNGDNGNENGTGSCNCNPGEAPAICAGSGSEGVLIAHENCNQFYKCSHGVPVAMSCYGDLLYNPKTEQCDWPSNVNCGDRVMPECDDDNSNNGDNNSNGDNASGGNNNGENGSGDNNNGENGSDGDNNTGGNGNGDNGNENGTGSCNCNPGEAPAICAGSGSEGVLIAHENCNQFYKCSHGVPVAMSCYGDLLYNPKTEQCDWPSNVNCGDRVMPECDDDNNNNGDNNSNGDNASGGNNDGENGSGDNNSEENGSDGDNNTGGSGDNGNENGTGSCNCNPGEAPAICAGSGSEGVLIAHENCNQFYKCSHGVPVAMSCYGDLLYNPKTEQCDWPNNVNCGDRVMPECNDDNNNNGDNNSNGDNASEGNNNGENGSGDNNNVENGGDGNSNENGSCNCNPGEAPAICSGSGSEGVLIAHENCNQFYKCANGVPVALSCYGELLYNPYTKQCDWADKVDCGERLEPVDVEDNKEENENINEKDDSNDNDNVEVDCDIPDVCRSEGSDGLFVAHENCNQFYVCSEKQATILDCPGVLLYDVISHRCEWPALVDCGDRNIIETEDNGNNNGGCNCNPKQAPVLCAHKDSDGELIAHENCDQFFKCSNGIPVTFDCTATLLYNPYKQVCDWPENVDCNGRSLSYFTSMNKHLNGRKFHISKA